MQNSRYNLLLCELHYTPFHGKTETSCDNIEGHFILIDTFTELKNDNLEEELNDSDEEEEEDDYNNIITVKNLYKNVYADLSISEPIVPHKIIRNYHTITSSPTYIKPEIGECIILPTGEYIVIIKTIWIKIIQRKWKCIFIKQKQIIELRKSPRNLFNIQLTGRWNRECYNIPTLKGMLSNLLKIYKI